LVEEAAAAGDRAARELLDPRRRPLGAGGRLERIDYNTATLVANITREVP